MNISFCFIRRLKLRITFIERVIFGIYLPNGSTNFANFLHHYFAVLCTHIGHMTPVYIVWLFYKIKKSVFFVCEILASKTNFSVTDRLIVTMKYIKEHRGALLHATFYFAKTRLLPLNKNHIFLFFAKRVISI